MGDLDADRLYHLSTAKTLRRLLTDEYGVAVADTNTVLAGWSLRHLAGSAAPNLGAPMPVTTQRPPSPSPPQYGVRSSSTSQPHYGASGPSANPPSFSGPGYYEPEEDPRQGYDSVYGAGSGGW